MRTEDYPAWLCLKTAPQLSQKACMEILEHYPDPVDFVGKSAHPIYAGGILKSQTALHLKEGVLPANLPQIRQLMTRYEISCLSIHEYPERVAEIFSPPLLLYVRGDLQKAITPPSLAVVGTRKASTYGREMLKKVLTPVCEAGASIISGLALGIDTVAHNLAVRNHTPTVGVLACGLDSIYPAQNLELSHKIIANGALVSEYEPNSKPDRWNFPARNRIISALADLVFVVEGPISSGALLTAKSAIEQGKDLAALPGNINSLNSEGPNHLIRNGAALISKAEDLLELMQISGEKSKQLEIADVLSIAEQKICDILAREKRNLSFDELFAQSGFNAGKLSTIITNLELKGLVAKDIGNTFMLI